MNVNHIMSARQLLCSIPALILAVSVTHAKEPADPTLNRLVKIDRFAFGGIGDSWTIVQGEKDYKEILSRPSALKDFQMLFRVGNPQARCYALVGIRTLDKKTFEELSSTLRLDNTEVIIQHGCIIMRKSMSAILKDIERDVYHPSPEKHPTPEISKPIAQ